MAKLIFAVTNSSTMDTGLVPIVSYDSLWTCYDGTTLAPIPKAVLTDEETEQVYIKFREVIDAMTPVIVNNLSLYSEFHHEKEELFTATIRKMTMHQLSGAQFHTKYHSVYFPHQTQLNFQQFLADETDNSFLTEMSNFDEITVVIYSFTNNVLKPSEKFNAITVSTNVFHGTRRLSLHPSSDPITVVAKPRNKKLFEDQKRLAQCNVNTVRCDRLDNAEKLATLAVFPILYDAGSFIIILPKTPMEISFKAYIHLNKEPSKNDYIWLFRYDVDEIDGSKSLSITGGGSTEKPRISFFDHPGIDTRIHISAKTLAALNGLSEEHPTGTLQILLRRDYAKFGQVKDLPAISCDLQPCFGYHLKLKATGRPTNLNTVARRKKRNVYTNFDDDAAILDPSSGENEIRIDTTQFGEFGIQLSITPNRIQFVEVFAKFNSLEFNDVPVLIFMVLATIFFVVGLVVAHYLDKRDIKEWSFLPLTNNLYFQNATYLISVSYKAVAHCENHPQVSVCLVGDIQDTSWRVLTDGIRKNFMRNIPENFLMTTFVPVGQVCGVQVKLDTKLATIHKVKLYIDRIVVVDPDKMVKYVFNIDKTFTAGEHEDSATVYSQTSFEFSTLMKQHLNGTISDDHFWYSLIRRPYASRWTRCERLATLITAIYLVMLANIMFYGKDYAMPRTGLVINSYLRISWFSIYTAFITAFIVIPPSWLIAFVFRNTPRVSAETSRLLTIFSVKSNLQLKTGRLPYQLVYFAWGLVAVIILLSGFFIVLYSLQWGFEKSLQWLSSMIIFVIVDIAIVQIFKSVVMSAYSSFKLEIPEDGIELSAPVQAKLNKAKKMVYQRYLYAAYDMILQLFYLFSFLAVISSTRITDAYYQKQAAHDLMAMPGVEQIRGVIQTRDQIYNYLDYTFQKLTSGIEFHPTDNHASGSFQNLSADQFYAVPNPNVLVLAPVRLRQLRVHDFPCPLFDPLMMNSHVAGVYYLAIGKYWEELNYTRCHEPYNYYGERRTFEIGNWSLPLNNSDATTDIINQRNESENMWHFRHAEGNYIQGWKFEFRNGGYFTDVPLDSLPYALDLINGLRNNLWIDILTSVFVIELTLFFPHTNTHVPVKVIFEQMETGRFFYHIQAEPVDLYQYYGFSATAVLASQGLWLCLFFIQFVKALYRLVKHGAYFYLRHGWNIVDIAHLVLGFSVIGFATQRPSITLDLVARLTNNIEENFISFDRISYFEWHTNTLFYICFFLASLQLFAIQTPITLWIVVNRTLAKANGAIFGIGCVLLVWTIMFAAVGNGVFGSEFEAFSSFARSMLAMLISIPRVNHSLLGYDNPEYTLMPVIMCYVYLFLFYIVILNLLIAVILVTYREVASTFRETFFKTKAEKEMKDIILQFEKNKHMKKVAEAKGDEPVMNIEMLEGVIDRLGSTVGVALNDESDIKGDMSLLHWFVETVRHWRAWNQAVRLLDIGWMSNSPEKPSSATNSVSPPRTAISRPPTRVSFSALSTSSVKVSPIGPLTKEELEEQEKWKEHIEQKEETTVPKWAQNLMPSINEDVHGGHSGRVKSSAVREAYLKIEGERRKKTLPETELYPVQAHGDDSH